MQIICTGWHLWLRLPLSMLDTREVPKERMEKLDKIAELLNVFPLKMLATRKVLEARMDKLDKITESNVFPLKMLATKKVLEGRMNYKDYIGGRVKEELDGLDRLAGKFIVLDTEQRVEKNGIEVSEEEWRSLKTNIPAPVISFLDGNVVSSRFEEVHEGKIFRFAEKGKSGKWGWDFHDLDGQSKEIRLSKRTELSRRTENWGHRTCQDFIDDGDLIRRTRQYDSKGKLVLVEQDFFAIENDGVERTTVWTLPTFDIKITRNLQTIREDAIPEESYGLKMMIKTLEYIQKKKTGFWD